MGAMKDLLHNSSSRRVFVHCLPFLEDGNVDSLNRPHLVDTTCYVRLAALDANSSEGSTVGTGAGFV